MPTTPARGKTTAKSTITSYAPKSQSASDVIIHARAPITEADLGKPVSVYGADTDGATLIGLADNDEVLIRYSDGSEGFMFETDVDVVDDYDTSIDSIHASGYHIGDPREGCRPCTAEAALNIQVDRVNREHPITVERFGPMTAEKMKRMAESRGLTPEELADDLQTLA
jgi:hypothetical protein